MSRARELAEKWVDEQKCPSVDSLEALNKIRSRWINAFLAGYKQALKDAAELADRNQLGRETTPTLAEAIAALDDAEGEDG